MLPRLTVPPNIIALLPEDFTTGLGALYLAGFIFCVLLRLLLECIWGDGSLFPFPGIMLLFLMLLWIIAPPDLIIGFMLPLSLCGAVDGRLCAVSSCWCCVDADVDICFFFTLLGRCNGLLYTLCVLCVFLFKRVNASGVTGFLSADDELSLLIRIGPFIGPFGVLGRFFLLNKLGLL